MWKLSKFYTFNLCSFQICQLHINRATLKMVTLSIMHNYHIIITNNKITLSIFQNKLIFQISDTKGWPHSAFSSHVAMKFPLEETELWTLTSQSDWGAVHMVCTSFSATSSHWCLIFFTSNSQFSVIQMLTFCKIFLSFFQVSWLLFYHNLETKQFFTLLNVKNIEAI